MRLREDVEILRYVERVREAVRRSVEADRERPWPELVEAEPPLLRRGWVGRLWGRRAID